VRKLAKNETRIKVQAFIEICLDFFTMEKIRDELGQIVGDETPTLYEFDKYLYEEIQRVRRLFKDGD
jgi:hypothetical protein